MAKDRPDGSDAAKAASDAAKNAGAKGRDAAKGAAGAVTGAAGSLAGGAKGAAGSLAGGAKGAAGSLAGGAKGAVKGVKGLGSKGSGRFDEVSWSRSQLVRGNQRGQMPWDRSPWGFLLPALLGLLGVLAAFFWGVNHIENDVEEAAERILLQERPDIDTSSLTFDATYRNVEVGGTLPDGITAAEIEEILEENNFDADDILGRDGEGEDIRDASGTIGAAPAVALGAVDVDVDSDGEVITLTGSVPSQDHRAELVSAAESTGLQVDDQLTVSGLDPSSADADGQVGRLGAVIGGLGVGTFAAADLALGDDGPVTGRIEALDAAGASDFNTLVDDESVDVGAPPELAPQSVNVNYDGQRIVLNGTVFDEEERATLVSAAASVVGEENVVDNLELSDLDAAVEGTGDRVGSLAAAIGTFDGLISAEGSLNDTDLTVNGVAADEAAQATTVGALDAASDSGVRPGGEITVAEVEEPEISLEEEVELLQAELDALQDEIRENVVFDSNSDVLTPVAQGTLDKVAAAMNRFTRPVVEVGGHTDSQGPPEFNIDLSQRRTESVNAYLSGQGIDINRLQAIGFGEAQPIADNLTEEGRLQNRRVEFIARASFEDG